MRNFVATALTALLLSLAGGSGNAWGGYDEARAAYNRGDYAAALRVLRPLAEQGNAKAQFGLGLMYAKGQGVAQEYSVALKWFRSAAIQGHDKAQYSLGVMYAKGFGVSQDDAEAVHWVLKAAQQGYAKAQHFLGVRYAKGSGVQKNYSEAVKWFRKAAQQGLGSAQFNLGFMYAKGYGVPQDDTVAVDWYRKAANQGIAQAQFNLGNHYLSGKGVPRSGVLGERWLRKAAEQGHAIARKIVGGTRNTGPRATAEDIQKRVDLDRREAERGREVFQFRLGERYLFGRGVTRDEEEAVRWFRAAAEQGLAEAQNRLALMYAEGQGGLVQNAAEAVKWFRRAAEQGLPMAQFNLGGLYAEAKHVPKDYVQSYLWLDLAATHGMKIAIRIRDAVAKKMTPAQIAEAQRLNREWSTKFETRKKQ